MQAVGTFLSCSCLATLPVQMMRNHRVSTCKTHDVALPVPWGSDSIMKVQMLRECSMEIRGHVGAEKRTHSDNVVWPCAGFGPRLADDLLQLCAGVSSAVKAEALSALQALAIGHRGLLKDHWDSLKSAMVSSLEFGKHHLLMAQAHFAAYVLLDASPSLPPFHGCITCSSGGGPSHALQIAG